MNKIFTALFSILAMSTTFGQDTLYFNNFSGGSAGWSLGYANNFDTWVVNNRYNCSPATPDAGGGNYLHIYDDLGGEMCASAGYYGLGASGTAYATMTSGINTQGRTGIEVRFSWLCRGNTSFTPSYGTFEYSTNGGSSWTRITSPVNNFSGQANWTNYLLTSAQLPALENQTDLRFRFGWVSSGYGENPAFSIDNIVITASSACNNTAGVLGPDKTTICEGSVLDMQLTGHTGTTLWEQSSDGTNWQSATGTGTNSTFQSGPITGTTYFRTISTQQNCPDDFSNAIEVGIIPVVTPTVALQASATDSVCAGDTVSFSLVSEHTGDAPVYTWYLNGDEVGSGPTFAAAVLEQGDEITVTMVSNEACTSTDFVSSEPYTVNIAQSPVVTLEFEIPVCESGTVIELTQGIPAGGVYSGEGVSEGEFLPSEVGEYLVTYTYTSAAGCSASATDTLFVDDCTGIFTNSNSKLEAIQLQNGQIHVKGTNIVSVSVFSIDGRVLWNAEVKTEDILLPSFEKSGLILVRVLQLNGSSSVFRFRN